MFTRILVPLDGFARSARALPVAARIARASGARLLLVRAVTVPASYGMVYEGQALKWRSFRDDMEEARTYLQDLAQSAPLRQLPTDTLVGVGPAAQVIVDAAIERSVDLVVLTSHGRSGLSRWVLGSVASHVAHHAPIPVFILRDHMDKDTHGHRIERAPVDRPLHVFVPLDGSSLAETVLEPARILACALAGPPPAVIHLALVIAPYGADREYMPEALLLDGATAYLEQVAQRLRLRSQAADTATLEVTWSVIAQGDIAHGIVGAAETGETGRTEGGAGAIPPCDLIAMATHGRGAIARWALGSVTERVLHATHLPLLIVRPVEMASAATKRTSAASATDDVGSLPTPTPR